MHPIHVGVHVSSMTMAATGGAMAEKNPHVHVRCVFSFSNIQLVERPPSSDDHHSTNRLPALSSVQPQKACGLNCRIVTDVIRVLSVALINANIDLFLPSFLNGAYLRGLQNTSSKNRAIFPSPLPFSDTRATKDECAMLSAVKGIMRNVIMHGMLLQ